MISNSGTASASLLRVNGHSSEETVDLLAVEEPLEIRVAFGPVEERKLKRLAVTMRTPGNDFELVLGFLFTEGIIADKEDVISIKHCAGVATSHDQDPNTENVVRVELSPNVALDFSALERHSFTSSSCGVCGKTSIEAVKGLSCKSVKELGPVFDGDLISSLSNSLRESQPLFARTGGLHATGVFTDKGTLLLAREDVGRHNAMDKAIGAAFSKDLLPLNDYIVLVSGRVSFELVQKALTAGVSVIAAVGAPSSLAVDLAKELGLTLIGFTREGRFNVYSEKRRLTR